MIKRFFTGFFMSFGMFCSIPVPHVKWSEKDTCLIIPFFPIVGLLLGAIWYGISYLLNFLDIHIMLSAVIITILPFILTGCLHLDGFMDTSDAILSRRPLEDKLRILKDSHTGAFAVISVIILFLLAFGGTYTILDKKISLLILLFIPVISRTMSGFSILTVKAMAQSGYAKIYKQNLKPIHRISLIVIFVLVLVAICVFCGVTGIIVALVEITAFAISLYSSYKEFDGISGDLCGYSLVIAELFAVLALAVL